MNTGFPYQIVVNQLATAIPLGSDTVMLAAEKNDVAIADMPVVNMWCAHTPNPKSATDTLASATSVYAASGRRQKVGMMVETIPNAGSTTT